MASSMTNSLLGSMGLGQGNIRNEDTRSKAMYNSPYGNQQQQPPWMPNPWGNQQQSNGPYGQKPPMAGEKPYWNNPGMEVQQKPTGNGPAQIQPGGALSTGGGQMPDQVSAGGQLQSPNGVQPQQQAPVNPFNGAMGFISPQFRPQQPTNGFDWRSVTRAQRQMYDNRPVPQQPSGGSPGYGVTDPPEYGLPPPKQDYLQGMSDYKPGGYTKPMIRGGI